MQRKSVTRNLGGVVGIVLTVISIALVQRQRSVASASRSVAPTSATQDKPFDQQQALATLREAIKGKEEKPAAEVFKNIQLLKGVPAGRFLRVMEVGYAKSLGVTCEHCHVAGEWEKDEKPAKQIARDMVGMADTINSQLLKNIKNLKGPNSIVNCTTCHRGQTKPALNLGGPEKKEG